MHWKVEEYENDLSQRGVRVVADDGETICSNEPYYPTALNPKHAHMIAAAPLMRAALEEMREEFRRLDLPYGSRAYLNAGNAIAACDEQVAA